ncbi:MAG: selenide, water dikinase SelD [Planctomycetes bacterium]|nr:selenide, water dikinase SelD [Planctomycetota bacterium]
MKDLEKRRRVMQRSMRLGHCICDPKKPCPCDLLKEKDVCLCAGERLEVAAGPVRLTRLVENAGCASKIDQASLKRVIEGLAFPADPRVLLGAAAGDDAGVYQLPDGTAIVQTVDVFTPSVDDPYLFGQVAAANSVSDIYAMGGLPLTALSIVGFPIRTVPDAVLHEILRGGIEKMAEAGVAVIGGHSINDPEIKAGFAVTGVIDPSRVTLRAGARPGDVLILTKPLGTGIVAFAAQIDRAPPQAVGAAARAMTALNKTAAEAMIEFGAHGCTDVTGFGLVGHLAEMAAGSGVNVEIAWDDLPLLPGVLELVGQGVVPGGVERNRESSAAAVTLGRGATQAMLEVCMDPQTSGGLLIAAPKRKAAALVRALRERGAAEAAVIGRVRGKGTGRVFLKTRGTRPINEVVFSREPAASASCSEGETDMAKKSEAPSCCPEHGAGAGAGAAAGASEAQRKFADFMKAVERPGALDVHTKEAVALALAVLARCGPCVRHHVAKARQMGFTDEEIDEAAWMAVAFGGGPVMMFYGEVRRDVAAAACCDAEGGAKAGGGAKAAGGKEDGGCCSD